jgi:pyrroline-5-carboxylate reductase
MQKKYTLGIIGGGFMARAILDGALLNCFLSPEQVVVSDPSEDSRSYFSNRRMNAVEDNRFVADNCEYLLLAVKPQVFSSLSKELSNTSPSAVFTIMAGKPKSAIRTVFQAPVARIMPNLPCSVGMGMSAIDASELPPKAKEFVIKLFSATGKVTEVDESQLNAVTGVSGSGPAYVYLFLQSLISGGVLAGLTQAQATELALQTVKGGVCMVEAHPEKSLQELIDAVSSKGGTTLAARESFEKDDFSGTVERAVLAATKRAEELSQ